MKIDTLLAVTIKKDATLYLAVSTGCWVKHESHVTHGVMTVVFLMNHTGYPMLENLPFHTYVAGAIYQDTYLHVAQH